MRRIFLMSLSVWLIAGTCFAQPTATPLGKPKAAENVNRKTFLNKVSDSMATMGKDPKDKERINRMRQEDRRHMRMRKQEYARTKSVGKNIKKEQKAIMKKHTKGKTNIGK